MTELSILLPGLALNLAVISIIIGFIYYPTRRSRPDWVFTYFAFNILIYFISVLLREVQLTLGLGFGLLAVFSTLRYRTEPVPIREMTYLFISISVPFINSLFSSTRITLIELLIINGLLVLAIYVLDRGWGVHYEAERLVLYEKIELLRPEKNAALLADLHQRTGLEITRYEIKQIDFLRDTAQILIYYDDRARQRVIDANSRHNRES